MWIYDTKHIQETINRVRKKQRNVISRMYYL